MAKPAATTALWVLKRLRAAGHQALFAGGCVRDMLLRRRCFDYDVATDATPQQVRRLFPHVLLVGAKFGVAMVIHGGRKVEVATFRTDLEYVDGRRPEGVKFSTPREDAMRRDFTINGMFYDPPAGKVIDYVGGRADLRRRLVRTIGEPRERFAEDYLRMMRAARFAVQLGFRIDPQTADAARGLAPRITSISGERVFEELGKMLSRSTAGDALRALEQLDLARHILPELFARKLWPAAVARVDAVAGHKDLTLALAALLAELPEAEITAIVRRWGGSNDLKAGLCWLAEHLDDWRAAADEPLCEFKRLLASEHFARLTALWRQRELAQAGGQAQYRRVALRAKGIPADTVAPQPLIGGDDLMAIGLPAGPRMGRILRAVYDEQLNETIRTKREAIDLAKKLLTE